MVRIESSPVAPAYAASDFAPHGGVVWLRGEYDVSCVAALTDTMARAIALDDADLVVDLSGVTFMGTAIVQVFIRAHEFLGNRSRSLVLRAPSSAAARIIDLCGIAELIAPVARDRRVTAGG